MGNQQGFGFLGYTWISLLQKLFEYNKTQVLPPQIHLIDNLESVGEDYHHHEIRIYLLYEGIIIKL